MSGAMHGGRFWNEVGSEVADLHNFVRADVLDAWFPPAPSILDAMRTYAAELCSVSPESDAGPLRRSVARSRGLPEESVVTGAGSSALIFQALPLLARRATSAVVLDPTYGEYAHVLESICGLPLHSVTLAREEGYRLRPDRLIAADGALVVLVNPNSPTGQFVERHELLPFVRELSRKGTVWIDETYIEYSGADQTLESFASETPNVVVCKSMSKVYALSGLRVAYLVCHPDFARVLGQTRPPWAVSLPGQICGDLALSESDYYAARYVETARLRSDLARGLQEQGLAISQGVINAVLVHLPSGGPTAASVCGECEREGVFIRDAGSMGASMGSRTLRIGVRSEPENQRILRSLSAVLHESAGRRSEP